MKSKVLLAALLVAPLALTACAKKEAANNEQAQTAPLNDKVTPEQEASIATLDKPVMDEKNTDVPADIANKAADVATPATAEDAAAISALQGK